MVLYYYLIFMFCLCTELWKHSLHLTQKGIKNSYTPTFSIKNRLYANILENASYAISMALLCSVLLCLCSVMFMFCYVYVVLYYVLSCLCFDVFMCCHLYVLVCFRVLFLLCLCFVVSFLRDGKLWFLDSQTLAQKGIKNSYTPTFSTNVKCPKPW